MRNESNFLIEMSPISHFPLFRNHCTLFLIKLILIISFILMRNNGGNLYARRRSKFILMYAISHLFQ